MLSFNVSAACSLLWLSCMVLLRCSCAAILDPMTALARKFYSPRPTPCSNVNITMVSAHPVEGRVRHTFFRPTSAPKYQHSQTEGILLEPHKRSADKSAQGATSHRHPARLPKPVPSRGWFQKWRQFHTRKGGAPNLRGLLKSFLRHIRCLSKANTTKQSKQCRGKKDGRKAEKTKGKEKKKKKKKKNEFGSGRRFGSLVPSCSFLFLALSGQGARQLPFRPSCPPCSVSVRVRGSTLSVFYLLCPVRVRGRSLSACLFSISGLGSLLVSYRAVWAKGGARYVWLHCVSALSLYVTVHS